MKALLHRDKLTLEGSYPLPAPPAGEALIRTRIAGICNTDVEIVRGYFGFQGVIGHEFVGDVIECQARPDLVGKRVVGEINAWCGKCPVCNRGDKTHCPHRTTLGIFRRDGVMAEFFALPARLLYPLPDTLADEEAVFVEPLAAACEILQQIQIPPTHRVYIIGDGKLAQLIAQVLQLTRCDLTVIGRHAYKLKLLAGRGIKTLDTPADAMPGADVVVEATGNPDGFRLARELVRPGGTIVLKSTYHGDLTINMSMIVVDEIRIVGSRCGPFPSALKLLQDGLVDVRPLIDSVYTLDGALEAFERAQQPGVLKVLLRM